MHLPAVALPGGLGLYGDPASQAIAARAFGARQSAYPPVLEFEQGFIVVPAFSNAWTDYGAPFAATAYYKDRQGIVHLRGLIRNGAVASAAFNLPAGYRPVGTEIFASVSNNALGRVDVLATGDVVPQAGSNLFFSLAAITFRAA